MGDLTQHQVDVLESTAWAMFNFGSLHSGRSIRKRDLLSLEKRGLLSCVGYTQPCDDNGCLLDHRTPRLGYQLTRDGLGELKTRDNIPADWEKRARELIADNGTGSQ